MGPTPSILPVLALVACGLPGLLWLYRCHRQKQPGGSPFLADAFPLFVVGRSLERILLFTRSGLKTAPLRVAAAAAGICHRWRLVGAWPDQSLSFLRPRPVFSESPAACRLAPRCDHRGVALLLAGFGALSARQIPPDFFGGPAPPGLRASVPICADPCRGRGRGFKPAARRSPPLPGRSRLLHRPGRHVYLCQPKHAGRSRRPLGRRTVASAPPRR